MARTPLRSSDDVVSSQHFLAHIELLDLATVRPHPRNDGHHSPDEIVHLRQSIREHDIYRNVVVAQDGTLLAGHGVILAAQAEGKTHAPGYRMPYGPEDPRALSLLVGDNHIARLREQDDAALAALLNTIAVDGAAALLGTGFDAESMAALLASVSPGNGQGETGAGRDVEPQIDRAEELREQWGVEVGQVWSLGPHRVICGDCTEETTLDRLMHDQMAQLIFTDPPYGVNYDGGMKKRKHLENDAYGTDIYARALPRLAANADAHAPLYLWYADAHVAAAAAAAAGYVIVAQIVWAKNHAQFVSSAHYHGKHEPCFYAHKRGKTARWYGGTNEVTLWEYDRASSNDFHPTQKPIQLAARALTNSTQPGDICLDGFLGGGSTVIAAENLKRRCFGADIEPGYIAVTLQRWADLTGKKPCLVES